MSLPSFWVAICIPVTLACFVWGAMYRSGLPDMCWSAECFNNAFELFKVPLALLTLIFPAVALIASHHRSVQTVAQIKASEDKNAFENYFKHQEYFSKMIQVNNEKGDMKFEFVSVAGLYKKIFPYNNVDKFSPIENESVFFKSIFEKIININNLMKKNDFNRNDLEKVFIEFDSVFDLMGIFSFKFKDKGNTIEIDMADVEEYFFTTSINYSLRFSLIELLTELYHFSSNKEFDWPIYDRYEEFEGYKMFINEELYKQDIL